MEKSIILEILSKTNIADLSGLALDRAFDLALEVCGTESSLFKEINAERASRINFIHD